MTTEELIIERHDYPHDDVIQYVIREWDDAGNLSHEMRRDISRRAIYHMLPASMVPAHGNTSIAWGDSPMPPSPSART